jgi:SAM-dependent methyltransferase
MTNPPGGLKRLGMGLDPKAEVFMRGDVVFRAVRSPDAEFCRELLDAPAVQDLMKDGLLISTRISAEELPGFSLVLEHPRIAPLNFPFEWTPSMLKAAALNVLELNQRMMPHGYCTVDGHPWNVLFEGTKPRFVDFTSIVRLPGDGRWTEALEFHRTFVSALRLMEKGYPTVARQLLREVRSGPDPALANAVLVNSRRFEKLRSGAREIRKGIEVLRHFRDKLRQRFRLGWTAAADVSTLAALIDEVHSMDVAPAREMWTNYYDGRADVGAYDGTRDSLAALRANSPKHRVVADLLKRLKPATVLDVACNRGPLAQWAAIHGAKVIGIDTDEAALDAMWRDSRALGTSALPLYVNVVTPAEPVGFPQRPFPAAYERLRSECVLCLALVHHLVFKQHRIDFEHIAEVLSALTSRHLVVEFVPSDDRALADFLATRTTEFRVRFAWYTLANLKAALARHFAEIEELPSHPEKRVLLLCTRRS